jgi:hypothetical protein
VRISTDDSEVPVRNVAAIRVRWRGRNADIRVTRIANTRWTDTAPRLSEIRDLAGRYFGLRPKTARRDKPLLRGGPDVDHARGKRRHGEAPAAASDTAKPVRLDKWFNALHGFAP